MTISFVVLLIFAVLFILCLFRSCFILWNKTFCYSCGTRMFKRFHASHKDIWKIRIETITYTCSKNLCHKFRFRRLRKTPKINIDMIQKDSR